MKKVKAYFVGCISGTGKSRILNEAAKPNHQLQLIYGSDYFMKWLGLKSGDYDTLRSLPDDFKNRQLDKMIRFLIYSPPHPSKSLLLDAYYIRINEGRITNAVDDWISLFDGMFLITAAPKEILQRIDIDSLTNRRDRNLFPPGVSKEQKLELLKFYLQKNFRK